MSKIKVSKFYMFLAVAILFSSLLIQYRLTCSTAIAGDFLTVFRCI